VSARTIDGRKVAAALTEELRREVKTLADQGVRPGLATVLAGDDYAARAYERRVRRLAEDLGVRYLACSLPADVVTADVLAAVGGLAADPRISGILVLRPLPAGVNEVEVYRVMDPDKDIEAVTPLNAGLLAQGRPRFIPSTPAACFHLLDGYLADTTPNPAQFYARSLIAVVGRSNNVGKPSVLLGLARGATVVSCDLNTSRAGRLAELSRQADVLIVAAGVPGLVTAAHVRPGAVVIDVGINPVRSADTGQVRLVGDVASEEVAGVAGGLTPVPGGVGPVTDVFLLHNTVAAAAAIAGVAEAQPSLEGPWHGDTAPAG